jgi:membrane-associated phospholipid phosphatase
MSTDRAAEDEVRQQQQPEGGQGVSRRRFLGGVGAATALAAGGLGWATPGASAATGAELDPAAGEEVEEAARAGTGIERRNACWQFRKSAADFNRSRALPAHPDNGDEARYANRLGSYSKALPHNGFGEVLPAAYASLLRAVGSRRPADFDAITMGGAAKLTNPQSGLAFDLEGADSHQLVEPPPPALASAEEAGEAAELYWMALLRDVPFDDYASDPTAAAAAAELSALSVFRGPRDTAGKVTPETLFRDVFPGCTTGPYLSQFMLLPTPFGVEYVVRQGRVSLPGDDHMTAFPAWLAVQNGGAADGAIAWDPVRRYLRCGRDIASWVHFDVLFQAYFNACLILLEPPDPTDAATGGGIGCPLNPGNPYLGNPTQVGFGTFGAPAIKALMCEVASRALKAQWYQKWFVHRRLRPEAFGGVLHVQKTFGRYAAATLHPEILGSEAVGRVHERNGSYLLPMCFPEGSPTHPAYGSGHATVAGACITVLKALFDERFEIPRPRVVAADGLALDDYHGPALTVGGELNKLASNIAQGRNHAGVHWRTDAVNAMRLGEQVALSILRDQRAGYTETFHGFTLTTLDGARVTI